MSTIFSYKGHHSSGLVVQRDRQVTPWRELWRYCRCTLPMLDDPSDSAPWPSDTPYRVPSPAISWIEPLMAMIAMKITQVPKEIIYPQTCCHRSEKVIALTSSVRRTYCFFVPKISMRGLKKRDSTEDEIETQNVICLSAMPMSLKRGGGDIRNHHHQEPHGKVYCRYPRYGADLFICDHLHYELKVCPKHSHTNCMSLPLT